MYYYLYEIRNNINGKIYVGVHKTKVLDDGYMGSGKILRHSINKHGIENFTKTILEYFDTSEEMFAKEKEIVNEEFLSREDTYNLRRGGMGGFDYINANCGNQGERLNKALSPEKRSKGGSLSVKKRRLLKIGIFADDWVSVFKTNPEIQQSGNTPEARLKAVKTQKETFAKIGHQQGESNSQFNTCWIYHELFGSKKCDKNLIAEYIEQGWFKGRSI